MKELGELVEIMTLTIQSELEDLLKSITTKERGHQTVEMHGILQRHAELSKNSEKPKGHPHHAIAVDKEQ